MAPSRILVLARDHVGDLVNTTGAVLRLREHWPQAEFVVEAGPAATQLFPELEVWVRQRHTGLLGKLRQAVMYRKGRFDLALILDDSRTKIRLASWGGIPRVVGVAKKTDPIGKATILRFDPSGHDLFDTLRSVLREVGASDDVAPHLPIAETHRNQAEKLLPIPRIGLFVGASEPPKQWPAERWIELARELGPKCVVLAGPGELALRDQIVQASGVDTLPTLDLLAFAAAVERLEALITADSGPAHIAGAVGTRSVVLYGPTDPARFHPWGANWTVIRRDAGCEFYGRGCAHPNPACPQTCMRAITVADVLRALG